MTSLRAQGLRLLLSIGLAFALWIFVSFTQNPDQRSAFERVCHANSGSLGTCHIKSGAALQLEGPLGVTAR